jgi:hypothetical protein
MSYKCHGVQMSRCTVTAVAANVIEHDERYAPEMTRTSDLRFRNPGYAPVVAWRFVAAQSSLCLTVYREGI